MIHSRFLCFEYLPLSSLFRSFKNLFLRRVLFIISFERLLFMNGKWLPRAYSACKVRDSLDVYGVFLLILPETFYVSVFWSYIKITYDNMIFITGWMQSETSIQVPWMSMNIVLIWITRTAKQPFDFSKVNFYIKGFDCFFL